MSAHSSPEPLNIGITTNTLRAGGAEKQRVLLANGLVDRGCSVSLFCLQESGPLARLLDSRVRLVNRSYWKGADTYVDALITGTTNTESAFGIVSRYVARRSQSWGIAIHNPVGPNSPSLSRLSQRALEWADYTIALTPEHRDRLNQSWDHRATHYASNGLDSALFAEVRARRQHTAEYEYDLGFIGRLSTVHKGLDVLIEALARPPVLDLRLAVAGEGPDERSLRQLAESLGVAGRISWLGYQDTQDFLGRVRAMVLLSRYEGQPMVLLEAMAAGAPTLVSSFAGGDPSQTEVTDIDDVAKVASDMSRMVRHPSPLTHTLPPSLEEMATNYIRIISSHLASKRRRLKD